jgi:hypothetical protein
MNKKAVVILSTILVLIVLTAGLLFYFWKFAPASTNKNTQTATTTAQTQKPTPNQSNQTSNNGTPKVLYSGQVVSPIFFDDNTLYFLNQNAQFTSGLLSHDSNDVYTYDAKSAQIGLAIGLQKVLWGDTKDDFIVEYPQNDGGKYIYYNSAQGEVDFPSQVKQLAWLPKTGRVIYFWKGLDGKVGPGVRQETQDRQQRMAMAAAAAVVEHLPAALEDTGLMGLFVYCINERS